MRIIEQIDDDTISGKIAKQVFDALWEGTATEVDSYIEAEGLTQVTDTSSIEPIVNKVIEDNPKQAEQYRGGKTKLLGFFIAR
ncbi:MAG: hypothetical protein U5O39_19260 [Gammaproteobacteria bacterium]|nr:hypothetical protein [Gammaproteobacteria bacterium]